MRAFARFAAVFFVVDFAADFLAAGLAFFADVFFADMRQFYSRPAVCEPRHPTWFSQAAEAMFNGFDANPVEAIAFVRSRSWN